MDPHLYLTQRLMSLPHAKVSELSDWLPHPVKGVQGHRVWDEGPLEIWVKPLADRSQAVGLFNRGESILKMTLDFKMLGVTGSAKLRDLWERRDLGVAQQSYTTDVPKHGVVLLRISQ